MLAILQDSIIAILFCGAPAGLGRRCVPEVIYRCTMYDYLPTLPRKRHEAGGMGLTLESDLAKHGDSTGLLDCRTFN